MPTNAPAVEPSLKRKSRRFNPGWLTARLVPLVLLLLVLGLVTTLAIVILSALGLAPAF